MHRTPSTSGSPPYESVVISTTSVGCLGKQTPVLKSSDSPAGHPGVVDAVGGDVATTATNAAAIAALAAHGPIDTAVKYPRCRENAGDEKMLIRP